MAFATAADVTASAPAAKAHRLSTPSVARGHATAAATVRSPSAIIVRVPTRPMEAPATAHSAAPASPIRPGLSINRMANGSAASSRRPSAGEYWSGPSARQAPSTRSAMGLILAPTPKIPIRPQTSAAAAITSAISRAPFAREATNPAAASTA